MSKKKNIVEDVLTERNFSTGLDNLEKEYGVTQKDLEEAVRFGEGRDLSRTPEQKAVSDMIQFHMDVAWDELKDAFNADPDFVRDWVSKAGFGSVEEMRDYLNGMSPGQIITRNGVSFIKTHDKKFQTVEEYIFRLEKNLISIHGESEKRKEKLQIKEQELKAQQDIIFQFDGVWDDPKFSEIWTLAVTWFKNLFKRSNEK